MSERSWRNWLLGALLLLLLCSLAAFGIWQQKPPRPLPEDASPTEFSAARAIRHIEAMAREPHRAGTAANYAVREQILAALARLGVQGEIEDDLLVRGSTISNPQNVLARIPGTANTKAFMMCAHYDSVPYGPGAADDLSGVAAMLETLRAIKAGPPLQNDLILLFSDAEERGLLGARSFLDHPWMQDVGMVLNFEARGVYGASYMFETSEENGWLIPEIIKAAPNPIMSSVMFDIYSRTPFSSDLNAFKNRVPGINVAFIGGLLYYHTSNDNPQNLSLASLQHHGSYALAFSRHFGNMPLLDLPKRPNAVYFNTIGAGVVTYPGAWTLPLLLVGALFLAGTIGRGMATGALTWRAIICGAIALLAAATAAFLLAAGLLGTAFAIYSLRIGYPTGLYTLASALVGSAAGIAVYMTFLRPITGPNLLAGALCWWLAAATAMTVYLPSGACLAQWPLIFGAIALAMQLLAHNGPRLAASLAALFITPVVLLLAPTLYSTMLLGTALVAPLIVVFCVMILALATPILGLMRQPRPWLFAAITAVAGCAVFAVGLAQNRPTPETPIMSCIAYALNADQGAAHWLSNDKQPDEWSAQFFPPNTPRVELPEYSHKGRYLKAPAPIAPLAPVMLEPVEDTTEAGLRRLRLKMTAPKGADRLKLFCQSGPELKQCRVNGEETGIAGKPWRIDYSVMPRSGTAEIEFDLQPGIPLTLETMTFYYFIPQPPGITISPRPPHIVNQPNTVTFDSPFESGTSWVKKTITFN